MYRSSTGDLSYHEDPPVRERWDRDRFERMRGGGRGRDEHDHFRFQEHERFPGGHRDIDIHEDYDRRGRNVIEKERFREDNRFDRPSRRRTEIFDEPTASEVANRALAPYRRKSVVEKDIDIHIARERRPARPQYIRRQSSLDTYDRKPLPRYGDYERHEYERDEWRPPANVPIPLPIRERRRSPSRRYEDFEEVHYRDVERQPRHEEYREVEIKREKSRHRRSRSKAARSIAASSVRSSSSSSFEEVEPVKPEKPELGRKGKTRMPKRLVKKQAIVEMGLPYEEEEDFFIVKRALEKEHIDEIIKISENYKEERTTYVYEDKTVIEAAPPPPPPSLPPPPPETFYPPPPASVHSHHPPPPPSVHSHYPPPPPSMHSHHHDHHTVAPSVRSLSPPRHEVYEERIEESNHIGGPLTVLVPEERRVIRSERDIKDEIRMLEAERRMLKYERETDYEIIERRDPREKVVRIEKDRKVRREPNPKLVAAMMATLS